MVAWSSYKLYMVAHLLWERIMLTPNLKLRLAVSFPSDPGHQRNFESDVNISLSRSRWATLYCLHLSPYLPLSLLSSVHLHTLLERGPLACIRPAETIERAPGCNLRDTTDGFVTTFAGERGSKSIEDSGDRGN